jgi:copper chaperone
MATTHYHVPDISCAHCKSSIESSVAKLSGIDAVEVDLRGLSVRVEGEAPPELVKAAIAEAGYQVESVTFVHL